MRAVLGDYRGMLGGLGTGTVDLVLTDPPYGIGYRNNYTKTPHRRIEGDSGEFSYGELAREAWRVLNPGGAMLAYTGWSTYPRHFQDLEAAGFTMREPLVCQRRMGGTGDRSGTFAGNGDWLLFGVRGGGFRFQETELLRNKRAGTVPNPGMRPVQEWKRRFPSHWFGEEYPWSTENPATLVKLGIRHPTVKAWRFLSWVIQLCSPPGGLVVDPFMGSGSTGVACRETGRRFVGSEIDREYYDLAVRRLTNPVDAWVGVPDPGTTQEQPTQSDGVQTVKSSWVVPGDTGVQGNGSGDEVVGGLVEREEGGEEGSDHPGVV